MARMRVFGEDKPFCDWMRRNSNLSSSHFVATDVDLLVHTYRDRVDGGRSRTVQSIQIIEVKTRNGNVLESQRDTLWKLHLSRKNNAVEVDGNVVINCGVSFVKLSGTSPDDSEHIEWGRFKINGSIKWRTVDVEKMELLISMEHDPQTLEPVFRRSHHKTTEIYEIVGQPLGFDVWTKMITRS